MSNPTADTSPRQFNGSAADKALLALLTFGPAIVVALLVSFPLGAILTLWPIGVALCGLRGAQLMRRTWERRIVDAPEWMTDEYRRRSDGGRLALVEHHSAVALIAGRGDDQVAIVSRGYVRELDRAERDALWVRLAYDAADRAHRRQRASAIADPLGSLCRAFAPNLTWLHRAVALVSAPWNALVRQVVNDQVALRHGDVASVAGDSAQIAALASAYRRGMGVQMRLPSGGFAIVGERVFLGERAMHLEVIAGNRQHIHGPVHGAMADSPLVAHAEFEIVDLTGAPDSTDTDADMADLDDDFDHLLPDMDIAQPDADTTPNTEPVPPPEDVAATEQLPKEDPPLTPELPDAEPDQEPPTAPPSATARAIDADFDDAPEADTPETSSAPRFRWKPFNRLLRRRHSRRKPAHNVQVDGELNTALSDLSGELDAPAAPTGRADDDPTPPGAPDGAETAVAPDEATTTPPPTADQAAAHEDGTQETAEATDTPERVAPDADSGPAASERPADDVPAAKPPPVVITPDVPLGLGPLAQPEELEPPAIIGAPEPVEWTQKVRPWTELQNAQPSASRSGPGGPVSWDEDDDADPDAYRDPLGALLRRRRRQHDGNEG